jgi:hypothetical protein
MKKSGKRLSRGRSEARPLFDPPRGRPASPAGHPLARAKPEERAHPAERKAKHKRRPGESE